jgi:hypothetical protein
MRFVVRCVLPLLPAFLTAIAVAAVLKWDDPSKSPYRQITDAVNGVSNTQLQVDHAEHSDIRSHISESVVNQWLSEGLPASHPALKRLTNHPGRDLWGHSFRCVSATRRCRRSSPCLMVFSAGADGRSLSGGEDPDDISLWNQHLYRNYQPAMNDYRRRKSSKGYFTVPIMTLMIYVPMLGFSLLLSFLRSKRNDERAT